MDNEEWARLLGEALSLVSQYFSDEEIYGLLLFMREHEKDMLKMSTKQLYDFVTALAEG